MPAKSGFDIRHSFVIWLSTFGILDDSSGEYRLIVRLDAPSVNAQIPFDTARRRLYACCPACRRHAGVMVIFWSRERGAT